MTDTDFIWLDLHAVRVWRPAGRIDHLSAEPWGDRLGLAFDDIPGSARALVLELSTVDFLSSAGLRELMRLSRRCRERGLPMAVCALQDPVREVFEIGRFNLVIPLQTDLAQALEGLGIDTGGAGATRDGTC